MKRCIENINYDLLIKNFIFKKIDFKNSWQRHLFDGFIA